MEKAKIFIEKELILLNYKLKTRLKTFKVTNNTYKK